MKIWEHFYVRLIAMTLCGVLAVGAANLFGFPPKPEETNHVSGFQGGAYPDGVYTGSAKGHNPDVPIEVEVTVKDGKISEVKVTGQADTPRVAGPAIEAIPAAIVAANSPDVDAVSGASNTSRGIMNAVRNALGQPLPAPATSGDTAGAAETDAVTSASPKHDDEESPDASAGTVDTTGPAETDAVTSSSPVHAGYKDGVYTGSAKGHNADVPIEIEVTVKDGKISEVKVTGQADTPRVADPAIEAMTAAIAAANSPNVDAVSGATNTSTGIINAVKDALKKAGSATADAAGSADTTGSAETDAVTSASPKHDDAESSGASAEGADTTGPAETDAVTSASPVHASYKDGVYTGSAKGHNADVPIEVEVTVKDGKISEVKVTGQADTPRIAGPAIEAMTVAIAAANSPDVDAVSGATNTSTGIINAVKDALKKAE